MLVATIAALGAATTALAAPPPLKVLNQGKTVTASQGSYCNDGTCVDVAYPLPVSCSVRAKARAKLSVRSRAEVTSMTARLVTDVRHGRPVFAKWTARYSGPPVDLVDLRLPGRKIELSEAIALDVFVQFDKGGDSNAWAGLATRGCRDADLPKP